MLFLLCCFCILFWKLLLHQQGENMMKYFPCVWLEFFSGTAYKNLLIFCMMFQFHITLEIRGARFFDENLVYSFSHQISSKGDKIEALQALWKNDAQNLSGFCSNIKSWNWFKWFFLRKTPVLRFSSLKKPKWVQIDVFLKFLT